MDVLAGLFLVLIDGIKGLFLKMWNTLKIILSSLGLSTKGYFNKNTPVIDFFIIGIPFVIGILTKNAVIGLGAITVLPVAIIVLKTKFKKSEHNSYHVMSTVLPLFAVILITVSFTNMTDKVTYSELGKIVLTREDIDDEFIIFNYQDKDRKVDVSCTYIRGEKRILEEQTVRINGAVSFRYIIECDNSFSSWEDSQKENESRIRRKNKQAKKLIN